MKKFAIGIALIMATAVAAVLLWVPNDNAHEVDRPNRLVRIEEPRSTPGTAQTAAGVVTTELSGYKFNRPSFCVESPAGYAWFPMKAAAIQYAATAELTVAYREGLGVCRKAGYALSQTINTRTYSKDDGACAYAEIWLTNNRVYKATVWFNMHSKAGYVNCRNSYDKRLSVALHEIGHVTGMGHKAPRTSPMNVDVFVTRLGPSDIAAIGRIY